MTDYECLEEHYKIHDFGRHRHGEWVHAHDGGARPHTPDHHPWLRPEGEDLHVGHAEAGSGGEREFGLDVLGAEGSVEQNLAGSSLDAQDSLGGGLVADGTLHASQYGASAAEAVDGQPAHNVQPLKAQNPEQSDGPADA